MGRGNETFPCHWQNIFGMFRMCGNACLHACILGEETRSGFNLINYAKNVLPFFTFTSSANVADTNGEYSRTRSREHTFGTS